MTKHTILFLAANPTGTDPLALDREARAIQVELERSRWRDSLRPLFDRGLPPPTPPALPGGSLDGGKCELREFRPNFSVSSATCLVNAATCAISDVTSGSCSRSRASFAARSASLAARAASSSAIRRCSASNSKRRSRFGSPCRSVFSPHPQPIEMIQFFRGLNGYDREVVLAQQHRPGEAAQTDFTHATAQAPASPAACLRFSGQCSSNGSGRVRQSRGCFRSDGSLPAATYGLASRGTEP